MKLFKNSSMSPWQLIESQDGSSDLQRRYQSSHQEYLNNFYSK